MSEAGTARQKRKYDDLSRDELVRLLEARDRRQCLGLVWETNHVERDKALNQDFVALQLDQELSCGHAPWKNLIIEGDNYDALRYLKMTFAGRVKCIYIDPPYNTGNKDFVYNDNYVDKEDLWRHSKWCEFMFQRLTLARELLREDGVIFVNIGEDEIYNLGCLMDGLFKGRKVATFVWRTRSGANDSKEYFRSIDHEYVVCYANSDFSFAGKAKDRSSFSNPDNDPRGPWMNDNLVKAHNYKQRPNTFYPLYNPETDVWYPCDPDNVWRFSSESKLTEKQRGKLRKMTMEQIVRANKVLWPNDRSTIRYNTVTELKQAIVGGTAPRNLRLGETPEERKFWNHELEQWVGRTIGYGKPRYKRHLSEVKRSEKPFSTWLVPSSMKKDELAELDLGDVETLTVGGTSEGTSLVQEILGHKDFPFPKPLSLVRGLLAQVTDDDDVILDFFAGTGTTAHAVLSLNEEEDTNRRFILVSNSEATKDVPEKNVCRDITRTRVQRVIEGYSVTSKTGPKLVAGLDGDFAYLRSQRIATGLLTEIEHEQVWTALQLTHMPTLAPFEEEKPFVVADYDGQRLIYVPHLQGKDVRSLEKAVAESPACILYTWQPELAKNRLAEAANLQIEAVPESLARRFAVRI